VDGDEVDRLREFRRRLHPEVGDVGIGDRQSGRRLYLLQIDDEIVGKQFAPQQHLVADDDGLDRLLVRICNLDGLRDLHPVRLVVASDPDAEQHLKAVLFGNRHHLVETLIDAVGAYAVGDVGEQRQILVDPYGIGLVIRVERRLAAAIGRVADAMNLAGRRIDDDRRSAQILPDEENRQRRRSEPQKERGGDKFHNGNSRCR